MAAPILTLRRTSPAPKDTALGPAEVECFELAEMAVAGVAEVAQAMHARGEHVGCKEVVQIALSDLEPDAAEVEMITSALRWVLNALESLGASHGHR